MLGASRAMIYLPDYVLTLPDFSVMVFIDLM
jgi:hypothetical protein